MKTPKQINNSILAQKMLNPAAKKYLLERGITEKQALELGFFSISKTEGKKLINQSIGGLAITYFDFNKTPIAYRVRPFANDWELAPELRDYYMENKGELPKFLSRPKTNFENLEAQRINKAYFSPMVNWKYVQRKSSIDIIFTEGEVKASLACLSAGIPTIGLAGVNSIYNRLTVGNEEIREFLPELEWKCEKENEFRKTFWENRNVGLVFDSDILQKKQVQLALINLANELKRRGAKVFLVLLPTEYDGNKNGLDDFLVRHGSDTFKRLVEQFKTLQNSANRLLYWDEKNNTFKFKTELEPIPSIKGLLVWSVLKDKVLFREGFGWLEWTGKYWKTIPESKVLGLIQEFRYKNCWLLNNDKSCLEDFKNALSKQEIEWNKASILCFQNGYLDTTTNKLLPHEKTQYQTGILPFNYNPSAKCPQWLAFLNEIFEGDQEKIEYLRAWFKWILVPKTKIFPIEATLWLVGKQGTGKGTLLSVLRALVGEENYGTFEPDSITNPNHLFGLIDKKLSLNTDATGFIANIGLYNRICSNEPVTVKNLYHNQFDTVLNTVVVLAMNKPLAFPKWGSEGLSRRLHVLNIDRVPNKRDCELKEKLLNECEGIFAWCWELSLEQVKQILNWRVKTEVSEVYDAQMTEIIFLKEKYPEGSTCVQASELYFEYSEWCKKNNFKPVNSHNFYLLIKKVKGIQKRATSKGKYYSIPAMTNYIDPEFDITTPKPTDIISSTIETMTDSHSSDVDMTDYSDGSNPYSTRKVTDMTDLTKNFLEGGGKETSSPKKVIEKPVTSVTPQTQQGFDPSPSEKEVRHLCQSEKQKGVEQERHNNHDELSKYKSFQSVGKLNSVDIREARNRSEKIRRDLLACSNKKELQFVCEEFGYLPREIDWVLANLLTQKEKAQLDQLAKQNQLELNLEKEKVESNFIEFEEIDFMVLARQIKEILVSLGYQTKEQRKQIMNQLTGLTKRFLEYTDSELMLAYERVLQLKRKHLNSDLFD